jgi:hypothetical protein
MEDPVGVHSERVEVGSGTPPPPGAGYGPYGGERVVASRTAVVPVAYRARSIVWLFLAIVDIILALRFIFYAAGANDTGFAHAMYVLGSALDAPFRGIFNTTTATASHPLHWEDILAIIIYAIAAWIVTRVMVIGSTPPDRPRSAVV